jgi:hypothetical protein
MKVLLTILLLAAALPANSTILSVEYDLNIIGNAPSNWLLADPLPTNFAASFLIDTSVIGSSNVQFENFPPDGPCTSFYRFMGVGASDMNLSYGSTSLWSAPSGISLRVTAVNPQAKCAQDGLMFSDYSISGDGRSFSTLSYDRFDPVTLADFNASPDPLADILFNGLDQGAGRDLLFSGEWGTVYAKIDDVHVTQVPEPGTLALFGAALIGFGLSARRWRRAEQRRISWPPT